MSEKEMLEMAAKAAGMPQTYNKFWNGFYTLASDMEGGEYWDSGSHWNPLADEGDRYRLAKALGISIQFHSGYVTYVAGRIAGVIRWPEDVADDAIAIVKAASEIGKSIP